MTKNEFLNQLKNNLKHLPENERNELLDDYNEHFNIGIKEGRTEAEIAEALGSPSLIAKEFNASYMITKAEEQNSLSNTFRALLATFGLGFFNLVFVLGPFIGIVATLISLLISGFAIIISGVFLCIVPFIGFLPDVTNTVSVHPAVFIFTGLGLAAFGILWVIGFIYLNKLFYQVTIKYLKLNLNIILNRRNKND